MSTLICVYSLIFFMGAAPLVMSLILGSLFDFADGIFDSIDNALEGIGIDLIPDDVGGDGSKSGFGTMALMAFFTLFGGVGLLAVVSFNAGVLGSLVMGLFAGLVAAVIAARFIAIMYRMQASGHLTEQDYIGAIGQVSVMIPKNEIGSVTLTIKKQIIRLPARSEDGKAILQGMTVEIVKKEGTVAIVKQLRE